MNIEDKIKTLESMKNQYSHIRKNDSEWTAIESAIEALNEKAERDNPKSLTLDELKERDGKPVYIAGLVYEGINRTKITGWFIRDKQDVYTDYKSSYFRASYWNTVMEFCDDDYGRAWVAYDHEPKGKN